MGRMSKLAGRRSGAGLLASVMAVLIGVGLWISQASDEQARPSTTTSGPSANAEPAHAERRSPPAQRLQAAFEIFRSDPEELPADVTRVMRTPSYGVDWDFAQRLATVQPAWALPGKRFVCLVHVDPSGTNPSQSCAPSQRVIKHGLFAATLPTSGGQTRSHRMVFGIVPDRAHEVRIQTPGFASATVRVKWNTFTVRDRLTEPPEAMVLVP